MDVRRFDDIDISHLYLSIERWVRRGSLFMILGSPISVMGIISSLATSASLIRDFEVSPKGPIVAMLANGAVTFWALATLVNL